MALKITDEQNYQDIADAIRSKLESSDTFLPSEMADAIESIPSGEGSEEIKTIFIDYDGTILHAYTQDEVDALTELPELPTHTGLTCQGWNWTLAELQEYQKSAVVGTNYITDDGKTRVYISIPENDRYVKTLISTSSTFTATLDWGDGTSTEIDKTNNKAEHTYEEAGDYIVTFDVHSGTMVFVGTSSIGSQIIYSGQTGTVGSIGAINYVLKIELGAGIKAGSYAFSHMRKLSSITIPRNITILDYALEQCELLKAVVFPRSNTELKEYILDNCTGLKYVSIPATVTTICEYFAEECIQLERIALPESLTEIKSGAFLNCYSLIGFELPDSLEIIGSTAFKYVTGFPAKLILSENITKIGKNAFNYTNIEELEINSEFTSATYIFAYNQRLKKVRVNAALKSAAGYLFYHCYNLKEIYISDGNTVIPQNIATECRSLKKVIIPDSVSSIGTEAFKDCTLLSEINFPDSLTLIESFAFSACHQINDVVIPRGVTIIPTYCFQAALSLTNITFLGDIEKIQSNAFYLSGGLIDVDLTNCSAVPILESTNAFVVSAARLRIKVPAALYDDWIAADKWSSISQYIVAA